MQAVRSYGVTLIELVVTMAALAILTAIAYPSYTQYVIRSNRAAVQSLMLDVASTEEAYILDARNYLAGDLGKGELSALGVSSADSRAKNYAVTVLAAAGSFDYQVIATPTGAQLKADPCGKLTYSKNGLKTADGSTLAECWR